MARADGFVSRDQVEATAAEQAAWIRDELERVLREWTNVHAAAVDVALAGADDACVTGQQEFGPGSTKLPGLSGPMRRHRPESWRPGSGQARAKRRRCARASTHSRNRRPIASAGRRVSRACSSSVSTGWQRASPTRSPERGPTPSTQSTLIRGDDGLARSADRRTAGPPPCRPARTCARGHRAACRARRGRWPACTLTARRRRGPPAVAVEDLSVRLESLAGSLHADAADARAAAENSAVQIRHLHGLRTDDLAAAELARTSSSHGSTTRRYGRPRRPSRTEEALRAQLDAIAARLEERDAERHRGPGRAARRAGAGRRVGGLAARADRGVACSGRLGRAECDGRRARTPPRRAGRRSARSRCVPPSGRCARALPRSASGSSTRESAYADAGQCALRRSIERPADAAVGGRPTRGMARSDSGGGGGRVCCLCPDRGRATGWSSFPAGRRRSGRRSSSTCCDGPLVVTRYGSSPLPLDSRSCAYLERA